MKRLNGSGTGPTLTRHLLTWVLGTMLVLWGVFVYLGYQAGEHESEELTDGHLASVAALLLMQNDGASLAPGAFEAVAAPAALPALSTSGAGPHRLRAHDYQQSLSVLIWNAEGALLRRIGPAPAVPFDTPDGFALLKLGPEQQGWRSFTLWDQARAQRVMVLVSEEERDALADDIAGQIGEPTWWLLPLMLLALGLAIHRGLQPLRELSSKVHDLEVMHPQPLALKSRHEELRSAVDAINSLVNKYGQALARERQLADAFAHELRTPLTALGLHVDQLRSQGGSADQQAALSQIETQARRANQVLTHLLAMARAGRASMEEAAFPLDLVAMSRTVIADHLPAADAAGHELSFSGDEEVWVMGHAVLVEIALRNLLENAIAHAPAASQIEVQANAAARYLQVCDGPRSASTAGELPPELQGNARLSLGLGLGHQVIQRISDVHGASFEEVAPPSGFRRCYRLSFP